MLAYRVAIVAWTVSLTGCGSRVYDGSPERDRDDGCELAPLSTAPAIEPILYYPFDGNARNFGTLGEDLDGVLHEAAFSEGPLQQAVELRAPGFVELPGSAAPLIASEALTIAFWFQEPAGAALQTAVFDCRSFDHGFHFYRGVYASSMATCWGTGHPANGPGGCDGFDIRAGEWHHILFQRTSATSALHVWVDGAMVATPAEAGSDVFGATTNDILIGAPNEGELGGGPTIRVDDLRVYAADLDEDERCAEFGGPWCPCEP